MARRLSLKIPCRGIQGDLLQLLGNYKRRRTLQIVVNEQASKSIPVQSSMSQGSVPGNTFVDDLLWQLLVVSAYANDCSHSYIYPQYESRRVVDKISKQLRDSQELGSSLTGNFWIGENSDNGSLLIPHCHAWSRRLAALQESIKVLRGKVDQGP